MQPCEWRHAGVDSVEQGRHFLVEGEAGSGRRLLARSACAAEVPAHVRCLPWTAACFPSDGAEALLFGERSSSSAHTAAHPGKLNLAVGGGLLLLHTESLPLNSPEPSGPGSRRFSVPSAQRGNTVMMTTTPPISTRSRSILTSSRCCCAFAFRHCASASKTFDPLRRPSSQRIALRPGSLLASPDRQILRLSLAGERHRTARCSASPSAGAAQRPADVAPSG